MVIFYFFFNSSETSCKHMHHRHMLTVYMVKLFVSKQIPIYTYCTSHTEQYLNSFGECKSNIQSPFSSVSTNFLGEIAVFTS